MRPNKLLTIGILFFLGTLNMHSQTDPDLFIDRNNSPYSVYGLGDFLNPHFSFNRGMGGLYNAVKSPLNINPSNPATYGDFVITNVELGFHINSSNQTVSNQVEGLRTTDVNPSYLALSFPIAKNLGFAGGFVPISKTAYSISKDITNDLGDERTVFGGRGDLYRSFFGLGYSLGSNKYSLSFGLNANYSFGKIDRTISNFLSGQDGFLWSQNLIAEVYRGWFGEYGVQAVFKLGEESDYGLILGLSGNFGNEINQDLDNVWQRTAGGGMVEEVSRVSNESSITMPGRIGGGISIQKSGSWTLGVDIEQTDWTALNDSFRTIENESVYQASTRFALGYSITPDPSAFNSYLKTIRYKFGGYFDTGRLSLNDTDIRDFGLTFGLGLPVRRSAARRANLSRLNLSVELGQRGTTDSGLIQESYIRGTVGITLNDKWFIKKKFD